jgi:hypothetical protein
MPADFVKCVDALLKQGKPKDSAYAICTMQYKKRHKGHTPQQDEKDSALIDYIPTKEEAAILAFIYEEIEAARRKQRTKCG